MSSPQDEVKIERIVQKAISSLMEKILFPIMFCLGAYLIYMSRTIEEFWPSLYLNLGSNLVVFVFLFWAFQYFTGKQPGDRHKESYEQYRNVIDVQQQNPDYSDLISEKKSRARKKASMPVDAKEAPILPDNNSNSPE